MDTMDTMESPRAIISSLSIRIKNSSKFINENGIFKGAGIVIRRFPDFTISVEFEHIREIMNLTEAKLMDVFDSYLENISGNDINIDSIISYIALITNTNSLAIKAINKFKNQVNLLPFMCELLHALPASTLIDTFSSATDEQILMMPNAENFQSAIDDLFYKYDDLKKLSILHKFLYNNTRYKPKVCGVDVNYSFPQIGVFAFPHWNMTGLKELKDILMRDDTQYLRDGHGNIGISFGGNFMYRGEFIIKLRNSNISHCGKIIKVIIGILEKEDDDGVNWGNRISA